MDEQNTTTTTFTLRDLLTQPKPLIPCQVLGSRNTRSGNWPEIKSVEIWHDFNLTNLNESYGGVLETPIPEHDLLLGPAPEPAQALGGLLINVNEDINRLICWNNDLMKSALQLVKSRLGLYPGVIMSHQCSAADKSFIAKIPGGPKRLVVDRVIALDDFPLQILVVGLGRPSSKWSWRRLVQQGKDATRELLSPVRQLANLCSLAETRYGYIQTDEELVICRYSKDADQWKVAIMPIPWTRYGVEVLTSDLALWWVSMLAMSTPQSRAIVAECEMARVRGWETIQLEDHINWVRRHQYSYEEVPCEAPSPPQYQTPSPGNPAAFSAAVGLNSDPSFDFNHPLIPVWPAGPNDTTFNNLFGPGENRELPDHLDFNNQDSS